MKSYHQLVHTLSYGDAISGEVLALQRAFKSLGHESEIYAINVHSKYQGQAQRYQDFPTDFSGEIILHYSLGSPLNALYRNLKRARRTIIHHNLTPVRWFESVNPRIVEDIKAGLHELPELCAITDRLLADSEYNRQELVNMGFPQAAVLPLPIDPVRWSEPRNPGIYAQVQNSGVHLLHVGRLAPNKCVEDIIKIFYFYHHKICPQSTLWLVGIDTDTELYSFALKRLAYELRVSHAVRFVGCMADSEVRALYEGCSAYLCMSEHEGFCVPLIEAMNFDLPVLAYASSAVPDTLGGAGILVTEKRHAEIAALVDRMINDQTLRQKLITAGKKRVAELSAYQCFVETVKAKFAVEEVEQAA